MKDKDREIHDEALHMRYGEEKNAVYKIGIHIPSR